MRDIKAEILNDIETFLSQNPHLSKSAFGELVTKNSKLVLWLSRGRGSLRMIERIYEFMANYKLPKNRP